MRRLIIDSNALQSPQLEEYLSQTATNFAVLSDYVAMEAYKGDTFASIFKSMQVLMRFPNQVIVLKSTSEVTRFSAEKAALQEAFIDLEQTSQFSKFCSLLSLAQKGNRDLQAQIAEHGRVATTHMDRLVNDAGALAPVIREIEQNFTRDELSTIRANAPFPEALIDKTLNLTIQMAAETIRLHPNPPTYLRDFDDLFNTFLFRHAVSSIVWSIDWIRRGGADDVKAERMRNDVVDVILAAYGTVFDGLMSTDKKARRIYDETTVILNSIYYER